MAEPSSEPSSKDKALSRQDKKFLEAACEISVLAPSGDEILFNNGKILSPNGPVYGGKITSDLPPRIGPPRLRGKKLLDLPLPNDSDYGGTVSGRWDGTIRMGSVFSSTENLSLYRL